MADVEGCELLQHVGETLYLQDDTRQDMREFVLTKIYGGETCGQVRASKWRKQKKKRMILLPPDEDSLNHHLDRTNYLTFCQRNFQMKNHPSPLGYGWHLQNGQCKPVRHSQPALPNLSLPVPTDETVSSDDDDSECGISTDSDED